MPVIQLNAKHVIDLSDSDVIADGLRFWISGESGSGKSNAAMLVISQWLEAGFQAIVFDAHGEYAPLWEQRPGGKRQIIRIGYGDLPVNESSVEWVMSMVREGHSLLIDLSHWSDLDPEKMDAFIRELLRDLYELRRRKPQRMMVLCEEAQTIAPQQQAQGQAANIRLFISLMTGGRKFGINFLLTSQRQSLVDSNVIAGCNVRLFMRISEVKDWKRLKEYVPDKMPLKFGSGKKDDIRKFLSGEALLLSRWSPPTRLRLDLPPVGVTRFL